MRRRLTCGGIVLLAAWLLAACAPALYTADDLVRLGAKEIRGEVAKQSRGSFTLRDDERTFRTGEITQYLPANYRSQQNDTVRVAYREVLERSGRIKYEVLQLEALTVATENLQLPNPIVGEIVAVGPGGFNYARQLAVRYRTDAEPLAIYLPQTGLSMARDGKPLEYLEWKPLIGSRVAIVAERIPILRGNALIYVAKSIEVTTAAAPR